MSRSVSTHRLAVATVYLNLGDVDQFEWDSFMGAVSVCVQSRFPSFRECDRWINLEDHVILENYHAEVSVSEYNGLVAVCLAPRLRDCLCGHESLTESWTAKAARGFKSVLLKAFPSCALIPLGRASNGEQFFQPVNRPGGCVTSKEGTLW